MRLNADTTLTLAPRPPASAGRPGGGGDPAATHHADHDPPPIRLVPYLRDHVPTYHAWMEDAGLRDATGSERLTLEQEAAMQAAWVSDADKLTFIILDGQALAAAEAGGVPRCDAAVRAMVGDVNLFFSHQGEDGEEGSGGECEDGGETKGGGGSGRGWTSAEVEIMVASPAARGRGFGRAAVRLMLAYARKQCGLRRACAKVGRSNSASLALFARLGFTAVRDVPVFDERHLEVELPEEGVGCPAVVDDWVEEAYGAWVGRVGA